MEWDRFDWRVGVLVAMPIVAFVVLVVRCLVALPLGAALAFAGVIAPGWAVLAWLAYDRCWEGLWPVPRPGDEEGGALAAAFRGLAVLDRESIVGSFVVVLAVLFWTAIDHARETLHPAMTVAGVLVSVSPEKPVPSGLALFGEWLPVTMLVFWMFVGFCWFFLPRR
jgi:hypothetical protein